MSSEAQASQHASELQEFCSFAFARLANQEHSLSPEDLVEQWREQHPVRDDTSATISALRAALADMAAGDTGTPLDEYDRQFRARHGLPPRE